MNTIMLSSDAGACESVKAVVESSPVKVLTLKVEVEVPPPSSPHSVV